MPNEIDLTTAATAAAVLGGNVSASDAQLARLVTAASAMVARAVGYPLHQRDETERPLGGGVYLWLDAGAVQSVSEVREDGAAIDASEYVLEDARNGRMLRVGCAWPVRTVSTAGVYPVRLMAVPGLVEVDVTAGYVTPGQNAMDAVAFPAVTLPPELEQAALEVLTGMWRAKGRDPNVTSIALGGASYGFGGAPSAIPPLAQQMISAHRKSGGAYVA